MAVIAVVCAASAYSHFNAEPDEAAPSRQPVAAASSVRSAGAGTGGASALGELPRAGDLKDVLGCAGTNEVVWTELLRENPRDPVGHEAKRKAGWYSAVAMWVFDSGTGSVIKAVTTARTNERRAVFAYAKRCRDAPTNWRE